MNDIDNLVIAASRALYKFSEGVEDWTEWQDLAEAIEKVAVPATCHCEVIKMAQRRLEEFDERLKQKAETV